MSQLIEEPRLFDNLCSTLYLGVGFELVRRNHGAPGIDGVSIEAFEANLDEELSQLQQELSEKGVDFVDDMPLTYHPHTPEVLFSVWDPDTQPAQHFVIQPDGSLADSAGSQNPYGNLLREDWSSLWSQVIAGGAA